MFRDIPQRASPTEPRPRQRHFRPTVSWEAIRKNLAASLPFQLALVKKTLAGRASRASEPLPRTACNSALPPGKAGCSAPVTAGAIRRDRCKSRIHGAFPGGTGLPGPAGVHQNCRHGIRAFGGAENHSGSTEPQAVRCGRGATGYRFGASRFLRAYGIGNVDAHCLVGAKVFIPRRFFAQAVG